MTKVRVEFLTDAGTPMPWLWLIHNGNLLFYRLSTQEKWVESISGLLWANSDCGIIYTATEADQGYDLECAPTTQFYLPVWRDRCGCSWHATTKSMTKREGFGMRGRSFRSCENCVTNADNWSSAYGLDTHHAAGQQNGFHDFSLESDSERRAHWHDRDHTNA